MWATVLTGWHLLGDCCKGTCQAQQGCVGQPRHVPKPPCPPAFPTLPAPQALCPGRGATAAGGSLTYRATQVGYSIYYSIYAQIVYWTAWFRCGCHVGASQVHAVQMGAVASSLCGMLALAECWLLRPCVLGCSLLCSSLAPALISLFRSCHHLCHRRPVRRGAALPARPHYVVCGDLADRQRERPGQGRR